MNQARGKEPEFAEEHVSIDQIVEKVKVIVQGSHSALFGKVVDSFFELSEPESFSQADLADIQMDCHHKCNLIRYIFSWTMGNNYDGNLRKTRNVIFE